MTKLSQKLQISHFDVIRALRYWALESYCLVLTQVNHCIVPYARTTKYKSNLFTSLFSFVLEGAKGSLTIAYNTELR